MTNPLRALKNLGQSVWLDDLHRTLITSGELQRMIDEDGLCGLSSNPSIFEKAIDDSDEYQDMLGAPELQELDPKSLYERIAVSDIQEAADLFHPVHLASKGHDGYVSFDVSPQHSRDQHGTLEEARRFWKMVHRENLMIKIPGTPESIAVVQELIREQINVSVTLLFTEQTYEQAAMAYIFGLEQLALKGGNLNKVSSVASILISGVDTTIDAHITDRLDPASHSEEQEVLKMLLGKVACANAKLIYQKYLQIFSGDRWQKLSDRGAKPQRLVWASTAMKNPAYSDVFYVEALIGPDTINTMSPDTLVSFRDHGDVRPTLTENVEAARHTMALLERAGIPFTELTDRLLTDGVDEFTDAFAKLLKTSHRKNATPGYDPMTFLTIKLFKELNKGRQFS